MPSKIYGIIGFPLGHSFSQKYFNDKFAHENIGDAEFRKFEIPTMASLPEVLSTEGLEGFCITIPHKKNIIPFLTHAAPEVQAMGACNCVRVRYGKLYGYNTDIVGFEKSFVPHLQPYHKQALILGTGGAAAAVAYVLEKVNIPFRYVSRSGEGWLHYEDISESLLQEYTIIINSTPLGTFPNMEDAPDIPYQFLTDKHYLYDLVYNPAVTKFLRLGQERGATIQNGYPMLALQAEENWRIWNA